MVGFNVCVPKFYVILNGNDHLLKFKLTLKNFALKNPNPIVNNNFEKLPHL